MQFTFQKQFNKKKQKDIWVLRFKTNIADFAAQKKIMADLDPSAYYSNFTGVKGFVFESEPTIEYLEQQGWEHLGTEEDFKKAGGTIDKKSSSSAKSKSPVKDWWSKIKSATIRRNSQWVDKIFDEASEIYSSSYSNYFHKTIVSHQTTPEEVKAKALELKEEYKKHTRAKLVKVEGDKFRFELWGDSTIIYVDPSRFEKNKKAKEEYENKKGAEVVSKMLFNVEIRKGDELKVKAKTNAEFPLLVGEIRENSIIGSVRTGYSTDKYTFFEGDLGWESDGGKYYIIGIDRLNYNFGDERDTVEKKLKKDIYNRFNRKVQITNNDTSGGIDIRIHSKGGTHEKGSLYNLSDNGGHFNLSLMEGKPDFNYTSVEKKGLPSDNAKAVVEVIQSKENSVEGASPLSVVQDTPEATAPSQAAPSPETVESFLLSNISDLQKKIREQVGEKFGISYNGIGDVDVVYEQNVALSEIIGKLNVKDNFSTYDVSPEFTQQVAEIAVIIINAFDVDAAPSPEAPSPAAPAPSPEAPSPATSSFLEKANWRIGFKKYISENMRFIYETIQEEFGDYGISVQGDKMIIYVDPEFGNTKVIGEVKIGDVNNVKVIKEGFEQESVLKAVYKIVEGMYNLGKEPLADNIKEAMKPSPKAHKYQLGDRYREDFDVDGMLQEYLKAKKGGYHPDDLEKLAYSLEDMNYHTEAKEIRDMFDYSSYSEQELLNQRANVSADDLSFWTNGAGDIEVNVKTIHFKGLFDVPATISKETGEITWHVPVYKQITDVYERIVREANHYKEQYEAKPKQYKFEGNNETVTLYTTDEFTGRVFRVVGKLVSYGTQSYAQYERVPYVNIIPKRKRNTRKYQSAGYDPYFILVKGEAPDPSVKDVTVSDDEFVTVTKWKYGSFDEGWKTDAEKAFMPYIQNNPDRVLLFWKGGKQEVNSLDKPVPAAAPSEELSEVEKHIKTENNISLNPDDYKNQKALNDGIRDFIDSTMDRDVDSFTDAEKEFIYLFEGSGGLKQQGEADKGTKFEFYTPELLIQKMWALAYKYGFSEGKILENSVGTGRFLDYVNFEQSQVDAYEINPISARICKILHPSTDVKLVNTFAQHFYGTGMLSNTFNPNYEKNYDLVIGNPPYGEYIDDYMEDEQSKTRIKFRQLEFYFIIRGLDCLKSGGLLVYVVPANLFNANFSNIEKEIENRADLVDAYKLPNKTFARTEVATSIIVLRKK